jgi:hypothetical protein
MRDEIPPVRAVAELPWLVASRLAGREVDGPWINAPAVRYLRTIVQPQWRVFEFGSGRSTVWYAKHVASVVAIESAPQWHREVQEKLSSAENAAVELMPAREFPARIEREQDQAFDLIVVDGPDHDESGSRLPPELDRTGCVSAAIPKLRPGGVLLLDNSDEPRYRTVDGILAGWRSVRLSGFLTSPLTPTESTFYWKPPESNAPEL